MFGPSDGALSGVLMRLDEHAGDADRDRGARQHRHEFALAARRGALPARLLHRMRGVEDHRRAGVAGQDRQRAHVGDQRVVAERGAALGHQHVAVAGAGDFRDHVLHVPGRQELALLDVDGLAGFRRGDQQVGLPAQERRDLQHVDGLRDAGALLDLVHVGEHRDAERVADVGKNRQRLVEAHAARALRAGAVGLVERGLVDEADLQPRRDLLERRRHFQRMRAALQRAGPRDQRQAAAGCRSARARPRRWRWE